MLSFKGLISRPDKNIKGNILEYDIYYRNIKNPRLEFRGGKLKAVVPFGYDAQNLIDKYRNWIIKKTRAIEDSRKEAEAIELSRRSYKQFVLLVTSIVKDFSDRAGRHIDEIRFRKMRSRWASIGFKRHSSLYVFLTFNKRMQYLPEYLIEYIIFHEVLHLFEKKHNKKFREMMIKMYSNSKKLERELTVYWVRISDFSETFCKKTYNNIT